LRTKESGNNLRTKESVTVSMFIRVFAPLGFSKMSYFVFTTILFNHETTRESHTTTHAYRASKNFNTRL
jgi:hypothetical protein